MVMVIYICDVADVTFSTSADADVRLSTSADADVWYLVNQIFTAEVEKIF